MATVFFLAVMAGAGYYVFDQAVEGGDIVTVPDIVNRPIGEAMSLLNQNGLEAGEQIPQSNASIPVYHVVAQRPAAGTVVRKGRKIVPTVSVGPTYARTPKLVTLSESEARDQIKAQRFQVGTLARIAHPEPMGHVLAQYPGPDRDIGSGTEIHLLISAGPSSRRFFMPDLAGKSVQQAMQELARYPVHPVAITVDDRPDAPYDTVLDQDPDPFTLVEEDQQVMYWVRASGTVAMPEVWREISIEYVVPEGWFSREVRLDVIDENGSRSTKWPTANDLAAGTTTKLRPRTTITFPLKFRTKMTAEIYLDGKLTRTYRVQGDQQPEIIDHVDFTLGDESGA